jgi:hypothetical protein
MPWPEGVTSVKQNTFFTFSFLYRDKWWVPLGIMIKVKKLHMQMRNARLCEHFEK